MKKYAEELESNYETKSAWESTALECMRENQLGEVKIILINSVGREGYYPFLNKILGSYCKKDQLDDAYQLLEHQTQFIIGKRGQIVVIPLLNQAQQKKRFDICENIIKRFIGYTHSKDEQKNQMLFLIETLLKEKQGKKAEELVETYSEKWEKDLKDRQDNHALSLHSKRMIPIYVQIGKYRQAWKLALQDSIPGKEALLQLHQAFLDAGLFDEAKQVEEKLNSKET